MTGKYTSPYSNKYHQSIFLKSGAIWSCGWEWNLEGENTIPFYPEIIYGLNPWWKESTTTELPSLLSDFSAITVSFEKEFSGKGRYNSAFDIWLCETKTGDIYAEVMIWINGTETVGFSPTNTISIDNFTYDFYVSPGKPFYIAFVSRNQYWTGSLNIKSFLNYLEENNYIPPELYLSSIEFGNEVWSGSGYMKIKNYSIELIR